MKNNLEKDLTGIMFLCDMINIYYYNSVKDHKFQRKQVAEKAVRIKRIADSIKLKELSHKMKIIPERADAMENEHALQLWRIVNAFLLFPTDRLEEFADGLEVQMEKGLQK